MTIQEQIQLLRDRAAWYRAGCDGLDDPQDYIRDVHGGLAADAASDLDRALLIIDGLIDSRAQLAETLTRVTVGLGGLGRVLSNAMTVVPVKAT
jgi:hypothetical protein